MMSIAEYTILENVRFFIGFKKIEIAGYSKIILNSKFEILIKALV